MLGTAFTADGRPRSRGTANGRFGPRRHEREARLEPARHAVDVHFDAYLLPEPTYRREHLEHCRGHGQNPAIEKLALVYDAFPR